MLWKGVNVPRFARVLTFFKTALFAVVLTFGVSNVYAVTSFPSGQELRSVLAKSAPASVSEYAPTDVYVRRVSSSGSQTSTGGSVYVQYFNQFPVPQTCNPGYGKNNDSAGMLDPSLGTKGSLTAYISSRTQVTTGNDGKNDYVPGIKDNGEKGIWGLLFADGISGATVINPWYVVYGKSGCMADDGLTPPDAIEYSETNNIGNTNDSGGHCWCKMMNFESSDGSQQTTDSPWVYLKTYDNKLNYPSVADRCADKCAADCVSAMKGDNSFFRAQVFGRYSACNIEKYDVTYEKRFEKATWVSEPEALYSIVYKTVTIPDLNNMDPFVFDGWCEETTNPTDETKCARTQTIPTGSYGDKTFYARWKTTISFEPGTVDVVINNNPGSMENQDVYYDQTNVVLSENAFERTGYDFAGWNCVVDGEPESVQPTKDNNGNYVIANYNYAGNMTCTALWDTHKYYVHYYSSDTNVNFDTSWLEDRDLNEDNLHEFTVEDINDNGLTIPPAMASSAQYDFYAWCNSIDNDCSDEVLEQNANQSYTIAPNTTEDVHLYAHWQAASYNITYYLNNENYESDPPVSLTAQEISGLGLPTQYTYAEVTELPNLDDDDNPGYNFIGWGVYDNNGNALSETPITSINAQYDKDDEDKIYTQPVILVGQWEPIEYTIKYYAQYKDHDTTNPDDDNPYYTDTFTVETANITLAEEPIREHFEFDGWYNFENNQLVEGIHPIPGKDWYLYAQWTRVSCEDGYYLPERGGTCYSCSDETNGYYPFADGTTATTVNDCYAVCPAEIADCPEHSTCDYDNIDENNRDYYREISSDEAMPSCSFTFTCNTNYHSNDAETGCDPDTYPIKYHDGENELSDGQASSFSLPIIHTYGVDTNLPNTYDIPHYDFAGWYNNGAFEGDPVTEILSTEVPNNEPPRFDFYAKWNATPYHIEFLHGKAGDRTTGFTGKMPNQTTVNYGEDSDEPINHEDTVKLTANGFSITGYDFAGWHCSAVYDDDQTYEEDLANEAVIEYGFDSNMVCTAQWTAQTFEFTRDCGDGDLADGQTATVSVYYDGSYSLDNICKPRDNYSITSWSCTNGLDPAGDTWLIADNSTCTANWGETSYNITYKNNDGTVLSNLTPATYRVSDTPLTVPESNPSNTVYATFKGWCVGETNNCTDEQLVTSYSIPTPDGSGTNIVMWANWDAIACHAGQYLDSAQCFSCPTDYPFTSVEENTGGLNSCYYNWSCDNDCPAHASCTLVSGQPSGTIHPGETYSCEMNVECYDGYTKQSGECVLNTYGITYHNVDNIDWATGANHPLSYTVEDSSFTISNPQNRVWEDFVGWCVGEDNCNNPVQSFMINPAETLYDLDLYAQWSFTSCPDGYIEKEINGTTTCEPEIYTITYMDGETELFTGTFTVEDETIQLQSATKDRYIFDGWCIDTPNCTTNAMVKDTINGPWSSGNKTLYAQWTEEEFVCDSGKFLHIGNDAACLSQTKQTSPSLAVGNGNKKYYLKMTQKQDGDEAVNMTKESNKQINILYNGDLYNAYDDSIITK